MARSQERSKWMGERHTKKLLGKTNWFKGKVTVEPPTSNQQGDLEKKNRNSSSKDNEASTCQEEDDSNKSGPGEPSTSNHQNDDVETSTRYSNHQGDSKKGSVEKTKKKRGAKRANITLGGLKKVEKATKRREKQKINRKLGNLGLPSNRKRRSKGPPPPTISVCFIDSTANVYAASEQQLHK